MTLYRYLLCSVIVLVMSNGALANDLSDGLHGLKWGTSVSGHHNLMRVRETDVTAYYVNRNTAYQVTDTQVSVVYGFYRDRFFGAFIKLSSPLQFSNLVKHFTSRYGNPKITSNSDGLTVYRWKKDAIKIKLKRKTDQQNMKMAIYYAPLADSLNQEQMEQTAEGALPHGTETKISGSKPVPLLNF